MAESEEKLKNLLMNVKEESEKTGLKFNIQKTKIMASLQLPASEIKQNFFSINLPCSLAFKRWFARSHSFQKHLYAHQFCSVALLCLTLCDPVDCSTPGFPVNHQLLELARTRVHRVSIAIQPSQPLSPSPPAFSLSQHQHLFQWISSSHQVAEGLVFQLQHQFFQRIFRTYFL